MTHTVRTALAVTALLGSSTFAHAGPLRWGYRAEAPDGTVLREMHGLTDLVWSDAFLPDPAQYGTRVPDPNPNPNNNFYSEIWRSSSMVKIIDEGSGQTGSFPLYVDFVREYELGTDGLRDPIYEGLVSNEWPGPTVLTLGGNTYNVRSPGGEFLVEITPGPGPASATPEPGTLALACVGLAGAALTRRLRRTARVT